MKSIDTQIYTGTDYTPELDTFNPYFEKQFKYREISDSTTGGTYLYE
jgi:hypothetical protein